MGVNVNAMNERMNGHQAKLLYNLMFTMFCFDKQFMLMKEWNRDGRKRDLEDVLRAAAHDTDTDDVIIRGELSLLCSHATCSH